jgi:hypothetical protein
MVQIRQTPALRKLLELEGSVREEVRNGFAVLARLSPASHDLLASFCWENYPSPEPPDFERLGEELKISVSDIAVQVS